MADSTQNQNAVNQGSTFVWHELYTGHTEEAQEFYSKVLDMGVQEMQMGEMGSYKMLTRNGQPVCGVVETSGHFAGTPPHWATYLSVDDVDARVELAKQHGGVLLAGPHDVPTVGRMALIKDPQGAAIWMFKSAPM
ncbi:MAG TPA: VOC family protein [Fimbriimonas sp.]|nr:VOC family protein [Fimbriimonas sp.]